MNTSAGDKPTFLQRIPRPFVAGLLTALPLALTLAIIYWLVDFIQRFLGPSSAVGNMSTVMCHFGGNGGTAVLALMPSSDRIQMNGRAYYGVLIPTAPVPFGSAILYVPVEWVEPVDITFDGLVNVYMSMGATSADYLQQHRGAPQVDKAGTDTEPPRSTR